MLGLGLDVLILKKLEIAVGRGDQKSSLARHTSGNCQYIGSRLRLGVNKDSRILTNSRERTGEVKAAHGGE